MSDDLRATHTNTSWRWRWTRPSGPTSIEVELAWVPERERWLRRTRVTDPNGGPGGWADAQQVALPTPTDQNHAHQIAQHHAGHRRPAHDPQDGDRQP